MSKYPKDELMLLVAISVIPFILISFDTFEYIYSFSRKYEPYQVDEIIIIL